VKNEGGKASSTAFFQIFFALSAACEDRSAFPFHKLTNGSLMMLTYSILPWLRCEGYKESSGARHATRGVALRGHAEPCRVRACQATDFAAVDVLQFGLEASGVDGPFR
jgi:hypothetical protein